MRVFSVTGKCMHPLVELWTYSDVKGKKKTRSVLEGTNIPVRLFRVDSY
jgi:hypothetical protein